MDPRERFLAESSYWVGVMGISLSILVTFAETLTQGRPSTNTGTAFTFWDGTFWDKQEAMFVIVGVASFLLMVFAFRYVKAEKFWLEASAYVAVIMGSPDVFRSYDGFIWGAAREYDEYAFVLIACIFLAWNVRLFRRAL